MTLYILIKYNFMKYRDLAFWLITNLFFAVLVFCGYVVSKVVCATTPQWLTYLCLTCAIICSAIYLFRLWSNLRLPRYYYYSKTRITVMLIVFLIYMHTTVCWGFEAVGYSLYTF